MANQVVYGFHALVDVFNKRVTQVGVDVVSTAISTAVTEHNRQIDAMLGLFVQDVPSFKTTFSVPVVMRNQPLDEDGRPQPVKGMASYDVAFPLQMSGNAIGFNYVTFQKITVGEVNDIVNSVLMGDMRWVFDHILAALFTNTTWTWTSKETGSLTIQPLANGDSQTYSIMSGSDAGATDNHYLAQAAGIADATNPYATIVPELTEHPENGGQGATIVSLIPSNLVASTAALTGYYPLVDGNIQAGGNQSQLVGTLGVPVPGRLIGYEDSKAWIVEYPRLPSNYIVSVAVGGAKPLGRRQDDEESLQGFFEVPQEADDTPFPYLRRTWLRRSGFGAWNRVGATVTRVGNGLYAIPTGFTAPIP